MNRSLRTTVLAAFILAASVAGICPAQDAKLKPGDFVAIIGDSITEQKDYSVNIENYLLMCQPAEKLHTMQFGWGGETAEGFKNRMVNDCYRYSPNVATTCYGMNDGGYGPLSADRAKWFHDNQKAVVEGMKKAGVRFIVVGSPGCVDADTYHKKPADAVIYNKTLGQERDIAKQVAEEEGVAFANVYDPMIDVMTRAKAKYGPNYALAGGDGVHPGRNGHLVMAYAFLKGLGCDGNIGTITVDFASGKAEATDGHKILSSANGSVEIESTRYPFVFSGGNPNDPNSQQGILEFLPFNQDLNRLTLVVKGASGATKVTWGKQSRTFDGEQLGKGINLAAEFLDNPFVEPFKKVDAAVRAQQNYETPLIKTWVNGLPRFKAELPDDADCFDKIINDMGKKDRGLSDASRAAVAPVKHTLKMEKVQ